MDLFGGIGVKEVQNVQVAVAFPHDQGDINFGLPIADTLWTPLIESLNNTVRRVRESSAERGGPFLYEPSENYGSDECVFLPLSSDFCRKLKSIYDGDDYDIQEDLVEKLEEAFYYFVEFFDEKGNKIVGVHRISNFLSALKKRGMFAQWRDASLQVVEEPILILDADFDFVFDERNVYVLRPKPFAAIAEIERAVMEAAQENMDQVQEKFADFELGSVREYVGSRKTAARLISSIVAKEDIDQIDGDLLLSYAERSGVVFEVLPDGRKQVAAGNEMDFLKALDRRLYTVHIIQGLVERFEARNRKRV